MAEPWRFGEARKLLTRIVRSGEVVFTPHARREMVSDGMIDEDVFNVLVSATWRYRVHAEKACVVVSFDSPTLVVIVTAWRKR
jgi:hypothetical protein